VFTLKHFKIFKGWTRGEATNNFVSHQNILDHDVILVSGNYRVGPLGFLSTEDRFVPGNIGFKDQAYILKWIQENIEHFGGDKNSVTIWGGKSYHT
jgi:carboxylesterase type B